MRATRLLAIATAFAVAAPAVAQRGAPPMPPPPLNAQMARQQFIQLFGGTTVYFGDRSSVLGPPARQQLAAHAQWLRMNPMFAIRIEGHGDPGDTRDHALALGAARAAAIRDLYILMGVPPGQVSIMSWGVERPGRPRADIEFVR